MTSLSLRVTGRDSGTASHGACESESRAESHRDRRALTSSELDALLPTRPGRVLRPCCRGRLERAGAAAALTPGVGGPGPKPEQTRFQVGRPAGSEPAGGKGGGRASRMRRSFARFAG